MFLSRKFLTVFLLMLLSLLSFPSYLLASLDQYYPVESKFSASNYGNTGIMEMPNANFMHEGSLRFNFSSSFPNEYTSVTASPFPWMEATYRYVEIKNKLYGPKSYSGNQSWKDKGFDIKIGLKQESEFSPAISFGLRDLAGTGVFSSEYFHATQGETCPITKSTCENAFAKS